MLCVLSLVWWFGLTWLVKRTLRFHDFLVDRERIVAPQPMPSTFRLGAWPFWGPFVAFAVPTAILWWIDHARRVPPGHCRQCGYNLTGNVSGRCPECGAGTAD